MLKKSLLALLIVGMAAPVMADDSADQHRLQGEVPEINSVDIQLVGLSIENLHNNPLSQEKIMSYRLNNNNPAGFTVTFHSDKGGKLVLQGSPGTNEGQFIDYTIGTHKTVPQVSSLSNWGFGTDNPDDAPYAVPKNTSL